MNLVGEDEEFSQAELEAIAKAESSYQHQSSGQIDSNQDSMLAQAGSLPRGTSSSGARRGTSTAAGATSTSSVAGRASSRQPASTPPPPPAAALAQQQQQPAKRRLKITYDQYMSIQTLILLHLADCERTTGKGMNRDDLIDWYLEQKEKDINTPEELEYETELIGKVLNKLVNVRVCSRSCVVRLLMYKFITSG
jgi:DNA replication licensing factor MCM6